MNLVLLALVPACFALNPVIGRALAGQFGPATLSIVRWALSALLIALVVGWRSQAERWSAPPAVLVRIGVLGVLGMGVCSYAAYEAARTTQATNIGLIYGCTSAFVAAWEIIAGRLKATPVLGLGIAACLFGVALIMTRGHPGVLQDWTFTAGDLWATVGMLVFVVYTVALRRVPALLTPLAQFMVMSIATTLAFVPLASAEIATAGLPALHERTLPWIAALVLLTGIGAYLGYNISLKLNGPVLTSASICLTPVYAAVQAMLLIGEKLAWYHGAALLLVVAGLLLVNRAQHAT
jgi:drug/metabolite transporter (DMT)-like permease